MKKEQKRANLSSRATLWPKRTSARTVKKMNKKKLISKRREKVDSLVKKKKKRS